MPEQGLRELYVDELKNIYSAKNQMVKALAMGRFQGSDRRCRWWVEPAAMEV